MGRAMSVGTRPLVPSRLTPGGLVDARPRGPTYATTLIGNYVALTKPRIIELLLITTVPTMVLAAGGWPGWGLVAVTLLGGSLAAGGANAFNMYVDRDIDAKMRRTQDRPLVTGAIAPRNAVIFAGVLELAAFVVLAGGANLLAATLALAATAFYVGVYTIWLKRTSTHNIVIGGAAGAVPVLVGWSAVTDSLDWPALVLFVAMFLWTPPHFWALAIRYADDYRAADVPMLPVVVPLRDAAKQMVGYTARPRRHDPGAGPGRRPRMALRRRRRGARRAVPRRHDRPRQPPDAGGQHARLHVQHHLRHAAVRGADARRLAADVRFPPRPESTSRVLRDVAVSPPHHR